ncbi:hypothetical protein ACGC1H_007393 [Rhizoctonia solani]
MLADLLTLQQSSSIVYDYLRGIPDVVDRLEDTSGNVMSTVFVPKNSAVVMLPRKPYLGPVADQIEILSGRDYDERSRKNIARWISAHVAPALNRLYSTVSRFSLNAKTRENRRGNTARWSMASGFSSASKRLMASCILLMGPSSPDMLLVCSGSFWK